MRMSSKKNFLAFVYLDEEEVHHLLWNEYSFYHKCWYALIAFSSEGWPHLVIVEEGTS